MSEIMIAIHVKEGKVKTKLRNVKAIARDVSLCLSTLDAIKKKQLEVFIASGRELENEK